MSKVNAKPELVHVWITKYALTSGILEADGKLTGDVGAYFSEAGTSFDSRRLFVGPKDWHHSKAEANVRVLAMIDAKVKSLKRSLAKMEKMRAEYESKGAPKP
jgi:hypothetical protein